MHSRCKNILVAEDNADDWFLLRQTFQKAAPDFSLHVVSDGLEALAYLKGEDSYANRTMHPFPDVLLLDLNMPRMNGFEVLEWIRHSQSPCRNLVVQVLTASSRPSDVQRVYALGANGCLVKPNRLSELLTLVTAFHQWHRFVCLP